MVNIRKATIQDALYLCTRLREQDKIEVMASHGLTGDAAVLISYSQSDITYTAELDSNVICMFGVTKAHVGGSPWLLGTEDLNSLPISFFRNSRVYIDMFLAMYGRLENYVDTRNTLSMQWLKWLGFTIMDPKPYGVERKPFHRFWKER